MTLYKVRDPISFDIDPFQTDMFDLSIKKEEVSEENEKDDLDDLMKEFGLVDDEKNSHLIGTNDSLLLCYILLFQFFKRFTFRCID
jgi:hypothetical protein